MDIVGFLFSPEGRIRRRDYWAYVLIVKALYWSLLLTVYFVFYGDATLAGLPWAIRTVFAVPSTPVGLVVWGSMVILFWPNLCILIKRWRDRNRPALLAIGLYIVRLAWDVGQLAIGPMSETPNMPLYYAGLTISGIANIWIFVECGCLDGTQGPNKFGPSPKGIGAQPEVF